VLGLQDERVMACLEQLIGGGESCQACSDDDHLFPRPARLKVFAYPVPYDVHIILNGMLGMHKASDVDEMMTNLIQNQRDFQSPFSHLT
jgi:hypothetical protein